jgi:methyl-accepting chemotaxis protein
VSVVDELEKIDQYVLKEEEALYHVLVYYRKYLKKYLMRRLEALTSDDENKSIPHLLKRLLEEKNLRVRDYIISAVEPWKESKYENKIMRYIKEGFDKTHELHEGIVTQEIRVAVETEHSGGKLGKLSKFKKKILKDEKRMKKDERRIDRTIREFIGKSGESHLGTGGHLAHRIDACEKFIEQLQNFDPNNPKGSMHIELTFVRFISAVKREMELHKEVAKDIWDYFKHLKTEVKGLSKQEKIIGDKSEAKKRLRKLKSFATQVKNLTSKFADMEIKGMPDIKDLQKDVEATEDIEHSVKEMVDAESEWDKFKKKIERINKDMNLDISELQKLEASGFMKVVERFYSEVMVTKFTDLEKYAKSAVKEKNPAKIAQHLQAMEPILREIKGYIPDLQNARDKIRIEIKRTITDERGLVVLSRELAQILHVLSAEGKEEPEEIKKIKDNMEKKEEVSEEKGELKDKIKRIGELLKRSKEDIEKIRDISADTAEKVTQIVKDHKKMISKMGEIQKYLEKTTGTAEDVDDLVEGLSQTINSIRIGTDKEKITKGNKLIIDKIIANFFEIYNSFLYAYTGVKMTLWDVWHILNFASKEIRLMGELDEIVGEVVEEVTT